MLGRDMLEIAGIELLPAWPVFLGFAAAGLALNIVPGADMTFIVASAARGGRRDGVIAALGVGAGALVHILAAVLGLSAILASSQAAFEIVKWLGAAWLLWLAFTLLRAHDPPDGKVRPPAAPWRLFRAAMLVNIAVALAAAGAANRLRDIGWLGRAARWLAATAMGALAVQLALASRRQA